MAFPTNPTVGQTYTTPAGVTYIWIAAGAWRAVVSSSGSGNPEQSLHAGVGAPINALGGDGDYYLDTSTGLLYGPRGGGVWPSGPTPFLGGPDTVTGNSGGNPPTGVTGANGDYFFDTSSGLMFGPKAAGAWPASPVFNFRTGFGVNTGSADALIVASGAGAYFNGMPINFFAGAPNTTTTPSITVGALGSIPIVLADGTNPPVGAVNGLCAAVYYGGKAYMLGSQLATTARPGLSRQAALAEAQSGATAAGTGPAFMTPEDVAAFLTAPAAAATTTALGVGRVATSAEATAGVTSGIGPAFMTPEDVAARVASGASAAATTTALGVGRVATTAEATAGVTSGSPTPAFTTPEDVAAAVAALAPGGAAAATTTTLGTGRLATTAEAQAGAATTAPLPALMTPALVASAIAAQSPNVAATATTLGTGRLATTAEARAGAATASPLPALMTPALVASAISALSPSANNPFTSSGVGAAVVGYCNAPVSTDFSGQAVTFSESSLNIWRFQITEDTGVAFFANDGRTISGTWEVNTLSYASGGSGTVSAVITLVRTA